MTCSRGLMMIMLVCCVNQHVCRAQVAPVELESSTVRPCTYTFDNSRSTRGNFSSPNHPLPYPRNIVCTYQFRSVNDDVISIRWHTFDLEAATDKFNKMCLRDYVLVLVLDYRNEPHYSHRYCGNAMPPNLPTLQKSIDITFQSSLDSIQHTGFSGEWEFIKETQAQMPQSSMPGGNAEKRGCGGYVSQGDQHGGIITSPGYPNSYPANVDCMWLIRVQPDRRIFLKVLELQLAETISECNIAQLSILDGYAHHLGNETSSLSREQMVPFCGDSQYYESEGDKTYMSQRNRIVVRFHTTASTPANVLANAKADDMAVGFKLVWTEVSSVLEVKSEVSEEPECDGFLCKGGELCIDRGHTICAYRTQYCIHKSVVCDGVPNCGEHDTSDEDNCSAMEVVVISSSIVTTLVVAIVAVLCCRFGAKCCKRRNDTSSYEPTPTTELPPSQSSMTMATSVGAISRDRSVERWRGSDDTTAKQPFLAPTHISNAGNHIHHRTSPEHQIGLERPPALLPVYAEVRPIPRARLKYTPTEEARTSEPPMYAKAIQSPRLSSDNVPPVHRKPLPPQRRQTPSPSSIPMTVFKTVEQIPPVQQQTTVITSPPRVSTLKSQPVSSPPDQRVSTFNPRPILKKTSHVNVSLDDSETSDAGVEKGPPPPLPPKPVRVIANGAKTVTSPSAMAEGSVPSVTYNRPSMLKLHTEKATAGSSSSMKVSKSLMTFDGKTPPDSKTASRSRSVQFAEDPESGDPRNRVKKKNNDEEEVWQRRESASNLDTRL